MLIYVGCPQEILKHLEMVTPAKKSQGFSFPFLPMEKRWASVLCSW